ncbi:MAG: patatin-like phospholipase family protein [Bdellovibrionales bacterium]
MRSLFRLFSHDREDDLDSPSPQGPKVINLALQGGGSHGAFTWGVLDRLLEEDAYLKIEGLSGTSAGAMNVAIFAQGYIKGGAFGARELLDQYWRGVSKLASFGMSRRNLMDKMVGNWNLDQSAGAAMLTTWQRMVSPYQTNPLNINPLRDMIAQMVDFDSIRKSTKFHLFICATHVETGKARVFAREELTLDALMASACLPLAFHAVEIDGSPYWDGGYTANPALMPLIESATSPDLVLVPITPFSRPGTPGKPVEIINRSNEISFTTPLLAELKTIALARKLVRDQTIRSEEAERYARLRLHMLSAEDDMREFGAASKFNVQLDFLLRLKELGRNAADRWLKANWDNIGHRPSVDLETLVK